MRSSRSTRLPHRVAGGHRPLREHTARAITTLVDRGSGHAVQAGAQPEPRLGLVAYCGQSSRGRRSEYLGFTTQLDIRRDNTQWPLAISGLQLSALSTESCCTPRYSAAMAMLPGMDRCRHGRRRDDSRPLCQHQRGEPGHVVGHVMKRPVWPTEATRAYSFGTRGWRQMSPLGIIGLIWIGFGLITIAVAVRMKLRPLLMWIIAGPLLGPFSLFWLGAGIAQKKRIPPYNDGSGRYGARSLPGDVLGSAAVVDSDGHRSPQQGS